MSSAEGRANAKILGQNELGVLEEKNIGVTGVGISERKWGRRGERCHVGGPRAHTRLLEAT